MAEKKDAKGRVQLPPFSVGSELHLIINCSSPVQAEPKKAKVHAEDKAWQGCGPVSSSLSGAGWAPYCLPPFL